MIVVIMANVTETLCVWHLAPFFNTLQLYVFCGQPCRAALNVLFTDSLLKKPCQLCTMLLNACFFRITNNPFVSCTIILIKTNKHCKISIIFLCSTFMLTSLLLLTSNNPTLIALTTSIVLHQP